MLKIIKERVGPEVTIVDPAEAVVKEVAKLLRQAGTLKDKTRPPKYEYLSTGSAPQFQDLASRLLGRPITHAKHVEIVVK